MKTLASKLLLIVIGGATCLYAGQTFAEGDCPSGFYRFTNPGHPGNCVPMSSLPEQQPDRWENRWGAIALDPVATQGGTGFVVGERTKRSAEKSAMSKCRLSGGSNKCAITITFKNQCVATAWGKAYVRSMTAATQELATSEAMDDCRKHDDSCEIFYQACSYPELIR